MRLVPICGVDVVHGRWRCDRARSRREDVAHTVLGAVRGRPGNLGRSGNRRLYLGFGNVRRGGTRISNPLPVEQVRVNALRRKLAISCWDDSGGKGDIQRCFAKVRTREVEGQPSFL